MGGQALQPHQAQAIDAVLAVHGTRAPAAMARA
jgi:hypothetical protein